MESLLPSGKESTAVKTLTPISRVMELKSHSDITNSTKKIDDSIFSTKEAQIINIVIIIINVLIIIVNMLFWLLSTSSAWYTRCIYSVLVFFRMNLRWDTTKESIDQIVGVG